MKTLLLSLLATALVGGIAAGIFWRRPGNTTPLRVQVVGPVGTNGASTIWRVVASNQSPWRLAWFPSIEASGAHPESPCFRLTSPMVISSEGLGPSQPLDPGEVGIVEWPLLTERGDIWRAKVLAQRILGDPPRAIRVENIETISTSEWVAVPNEFVERTGASPLGSGAPQKHEQDLAERN